MIMRELEMTEAPLPAANASEIKVDQRRAYAIVAWHYDQKLKGLKPPALRKIVSSECGLGKAKAIHNITYLFYSGKSSKKI